MRSTWPADEVVGVVAVGALAIVVGLAVVVIEAHAATGGVLAVAGVMALAAGVGLIMAGSGAALALTIPVAVVFAVSGMLAVMLMAHKVMAAHQQALRTGPTTLVGTVATVRTWNQDEGQVAADGTLWRAVLSCGWQDRVPAPGDLVVVDALDGLTVSIRSSRPPGR